MRLHLVPIAEVASRLVSKQLLILTVILLLPLIASCGTVTTPPTQPVATPAPEATLTPGVVMGTPTPAPAVATSPKVAKDLARLVIPEEPSVLNVFATSSAEEASLTRDTMNDPLIWYDRETLELVSTSGVTGWRQEAPDRWRLFLRQGVKFHNGEPWNGEAAAYSLNIIGKPESDATSYNYTGSISAEVVDESTVDILCAVPCPIMDRSLAWTTFQAPKWYAASPPEVVAAMTISFGPYKLAEYSRGESIRLDAYEDYVPVAGVAEMQKANIKELLYVWRVEDLVRAAMLRAGEADWAWNIGVENMNQVPVAKVGGTMESMSWYIDTLWHPMLKQKQFRQAMMHAIDCQEIVETLYQGVTTCRGIPASLDVVGATAENIAPYEYNPELSRQLLKEVNYQGEEIKISGREARVPKQTELYEAVAGYLEQVGINVKVEILERSVWTTMRNCNPKEGYPEKKPDCDFGQIVETAPSYENLDFSKMVTREMDCNSSFGRVCDRERIQPLIEPALSATGEERRRRMEELANIMKEDVQRMTLMDTFVIYGMVEDLKWEPRPDQAVRGSTMSFAQ
jgi:peptide/nickel transport system substrate-binding protein